MVKTKNNKLKPGVKLFGDNYIGEKVDDLLITPLKEKNLPYVGPIMKDECPSADEIILTYDMLPKISLYVLEQFLYIMIFSVMLFELGLFAKYYSVHYEEFKFVDVGLVFVGLLLMTIFYALVAFLIIPNMIMLCNERLGLSFVKIMVIRGLLILAVYYVHNQLYEYFSNKFYIYLAKIGKLGNDSFHTPKFKQYRQESINYITKKIKVFQPYVVSTICDGGKPLPILKEIFSTEYYTKLENSCAQNKLDGDLQKNIDQFVQKLQTFK